MFAFIHGPTATVTMHRSSLPVVEIVAINENTSNECARETFLLAKHAFVFPHLKPRVCPQLGSVSLSMGDGSVSQQSGEGVFFRVFNSEKVCASKRYNFRNLRRTKIRKNQFLPPFD